MYYESKRDQNKKKELPVAYTEDAQLHQAPTRVRHNTVSACVTDLDQT